VAKRAVLFDLDETLLQERPSTSAAILAVGAAHGIDGPALEAAVREVGPPLWRQGPAFAYCEAIGISWWEGLAGPFGPSPVAGLAALHAWIAGYREAVWTAALRRLGRDGSPRELAAAFAADRLGRQVLYPDALPALAHLKATHRLGLVTNGAPDYQALKLDGCGLRPYFATVVVSGEVGWGKPDPRIFRLALARLGCEPADAAMVGDNPARDVAGARAAGVMAVLVDRGLGADASDADAVVRDLRELAGLLA
jgi:HAD superfamily hydrolase (TIGR01509 family)